MMGFRRSPAPTFLACRDTIGRMDREAGSSSFDADDPASAGAALGRLLDADGPGRWRGARVQLCCSPPWAELRQVRGVPPVADPALIGAMLSEDPARFFPRRATPPIVSRPQVTGAGRAVVALFDRSLVDAMRAAVESRGGRVSLVVSALEAAARSQPGQTARLSDGVTVHAAQVAPAGVLTLTVDGDAEAGGAGDAGSWQAVVGACALRFEPPRRVQRGGMPILPLVMAVAAMLGCAAAPEIATRMALRRALDERQALSGAARQAGQVARRLRSANETLVAAAEFKARGRPMLSTLASLARDLPRPGAVVSFRADSAGGSLVALLPPGELATAALPASDVEGAELSGTVIREGLGGAEVERSAVRFRWRRGSPPEATP